MATTAELRRREIIEELLHNQAVSVSDLSRRHGVSEVSIRRDLRRLQAQGRLRRIHGGALVSEGGLEHGAAVNAQVIPANDAHRDQKQRIGRAGAELIQPGDRIFFDSGTTVLEVARHLSPALRERGNLTAITNSLLIVTELGPCSGIHLILLGGIYLDRYAAIVGPSAISQLASLHVDKIFVGADGVSLSNGVTNANVLEAEVDRVAIAVASQVIVVADSSKIGRIGLTTLAPLSDIHMLITDADAPKEFVEQLKALSLEIVLV